MKQKKIFEQLLSEKEQKEISVLIGPRQVGKTTLLKQLHKELGGIFLDIDLYSDYKKISSYESFVDNLKLNGYDLQQKNFFYVFLDEFQRYKDISIILKNIYDHHDNIKLFVSGSSSLTIKNSIQESLAGRKNITYIQPLSFNEFLDFKDRDDLLERVANLPSIYPKASQIKDVAALLPELKTEFEEFLVYGGYPKVALTKRTSAKLKVLEQIFDLYVKKDLLDYLNVEKIDHFKKLIQKLAVNHGGICTYSDYAAVTGLDEKTVRHYFSLLEETFLINIIRPFFTNKNKEISKSPKIYFCDNGVRNFFINNFGIAKH